MVILVLMRFCRVKMVFVLRGGFSGFWFCVLVVLMLFLVCFEMRWCLKWVMVLKMWKISLLVVDVVLICFFRLISLIF